MLAALRSVCGKNIPYFALVCLYHVSARKYNGIIKEQEPQGREEDLMKHVFKAQKLGWDKETEGVWFDSSDYTREEAEAEFKPFEGTTQKGYPYTGYERDGEKYFKVKYLGEFADDDLPKSDADLLNKLLNR